MIQCYRILLLYYIIATTTRTVTTTTIDVTICKEKYSNRTYIPFDVDKLNVPPLLASLPGSGNSWLRLLLEFATGYYTGSIYGDPTISELFPGEIHCGKRMVVIKAHPGNLIVESKTGTIGINTKDATVRCKKGMIQSFNRIIFITRDPWSTIFSEYSRRQSGQKHNVSITSNLFNENNWIRQAIMQAHDFTEFWNDQFVKMKKLLKSNIEIFRYEDFLNESTRIDALTNIIKFINITKDYNISKERLECAFLLSESSIIHRNKSTEITINQVYSDKRLVCQLEVEFKKIGMYEELGYLTTWNNTDCSDTRPYVKSIGSWVYAVDANLFKVIIKSGETEFLKKCRYVADTKNPKWLLLRCPADVLPLIEDKS